MHHESPNPNRGLPRGAAGETAPPPPKLATILSSESSKSIDRKGGRNCDSNNPFFTHWKRHLFTFAFGCFNSEVRNKISSLRGRKHIFMKLWLTIFGVRELWRTRSIYNKLRIWGYMLLDVLKNCSVNSDWNTLRETWTAKILYTVHISHWRWILKILNH